MEIHGLSHIGRKRKLNEDSFFVENDNIGAYALVADGMGGHQAGEVASSMVCDVIHQLVKEHFREGMSVEEAEKIVRKAFIEANNKVYCYAKTHLRMMGLGTTSTFAMLYSGKLIIAHVGDSRVYTINDDGIQRRTTDHSYVQELVARGELTPEQAEHHPNKNYITRAMGTEEYIKVDSSIEDYHGEIVLICSDGLTNMVTEKEIRNILCQAPSLAEGTKELINRANENGGIDNITAVALQDRGMKS